MLWSRNGAAGITRSNGVAASKGGTMKVALMVICAGDPT